MKRCLLIFAFFVGLIPNMKEMTLESVYCVMGQGMYDEDGEYQCVNASEQVCHLCYGCYDIMDDFCPNCYFYCDVCKLTLSKDAYHKHDTNGDSIFENEDPSGTGDYKEGDKIFRMIYICMTCKQRFEQLSDVKVHAAQKNHTGFDTDYEPIN